MCIYLVFENTLLPPTRYAEAHAFAAGLLVDEHQLKNRLALHKTKSVGGDGKEEEGGEGKGGGGRGGGEGPGGSDDIIDVAAGVEGGGGDGSDGASMTGLAAEGGRTQEETKGETKSDTGATEGTSGGGASGTVSGI